ncbi:VirB4 family type IV secretion system protein [Streptomyces paromomycinus]|uniref:ATP-binding protein n=1 Tax=Streptomyces paromomycinus TaxID=92743 RepID=A0A401VUR0_STREY|nr:conjugal transfer protein TraC [Streptomyces paromomycinus]GCD40805.1 ATP-binding protein [Streptomyces paromomycinus]
MVKHRRAARARYGRCSGPRATAPAADATAAFLPDALTVAPRHLEVGDAWVASFAVTGYPREVQPGWLQPLLTYPGRLDVALHIEPIDPFTAARRLKRQLARLESGRRHTQEKGRLLDPQIEAATEDAYDLSARVARGEGKLFRLGLYLTVRAASAQHLAQEVAAVRALAASLLLDAKPTTYRSLQGWLTCLPFGLDRITLRRTLDTSALAASFPFTSPDLPAPTPASAAVPAGVLYGYNTATQGLVHWDRFAQDNHNAVVLGRSGAGKSYLVKLEVLRSLYRGIDAHVIDPEDEYTRLAEAVGGTCLRLGTKGVRLNPFDLPLRTDPHGQPTAPRDALVRRSLFLHTVLAVLLSTPLAPAQRAVLDQALAATYRRTGITADPRTWTRPPPLLADLASTLEGCAQPTARELADHLHPFVRGAFADLFAGPTTTRPDGHLVVYCLRDLPDELQAIATLLVLDAIWQHVSDPSRRRPRYVVADEAWLLMQQPAGADFLFRMAKAARKHWAGLTVATQDTADVLATDLGRAVVTNAATQILLRQAPQAIDEVTAVFDLSEGERAFLLAADRGQGLLSTGTHRTAFQAAASPAEHRLITTDPAELATYEPEVAVDTVAHTSVGQHEMDLFDETPDPPAKSGVA